MWILKLKSVNSEVKSVDSEVKKCGFVKKNSHFFYCLLPKVWFNIKSTIILMKLDDNSDNMAYGQQIVPRLVHQWFLVV